MSIQPMRGKLAPMQNTNVVVSFTPKARPMLTTVPSLASKLWRAMACYRRLASSRRTSSSGTVPLPRLSSAISGRENRNDPGSSLYSHTMRCCGEVRAGTRVVESSQGQMGMFKIWDRFVRSRILCLSGPGPG